MSEQQASADTARNGPAAGAATRADLTRPFPYYIGAKTTQPPHSFIAAIHRDDPPVFWAEATSIGSAWVPRRMEELRAIYLDNEHFSVTGASFFSRLIGETWVNVPSEIDPPLHTALRSAINPLFTPKRMAALDDTVRTYARGAIATFKDRCECELMNEFAFEFPIRVFMELMGLPPADMKQLLAWEHGLLHGLDMAAVVATTKEITAYLRTVIEKRRAEPADDFVSYGLQARVQERGFTDDEMMGFCFNLFVGGLDTVSTNIGHQFRHLAERHDHQALLRRKPGRIPEAIEELMRAYAAVVTPRSCIREVEVAGVTMMPGDKVLMSTFLANRDPEAFPDPEEVILDRKPRHIGFGYGVHSCIGMHLAKREMKIAIEEFLAAIPEFRVKPGAQIESYLGGMVTPILLPLVW